MNQRQCIERFLEHRPGKASNLTSDGVSLWSYDWWQMAQWMDGVVIVRYGAGYSQSTKCQGSALRSVLAIKRPDIKVSRSEPTPVRSAYMTLA